MLKIKHTPHINLPHMNLSASQMQLSPVPIDDDELTQAIVRDPENNDNNWELNERPDMGELTEFWSAVETDVQNDPEWFRFSDE